MSGSRICLPGAAEPDRGAFEVGLGAVIHGEPAWIRAVAAAATAGERAGQTQYGPVGAGFSRFGGSETTGEPRRREPTLRGLAANTADEKHHGYARNYALQAKGKDLGGSTDFR